MIKIAFDAIYKYELPVGHRFPMEKYELLPQQLLYENTIQSSQFFKPKKLTQEEILLTHCKDYLENLDSLNLTRKEIRNIGFPVSKNLIERGKYISGGTYQCACYAMEFGVSLNIAGGTHHSYRDKGEGFCIFNDFAIASNLLLARNMAKRILIIDLDVHQGNGTASIFQGNPNVYTFSMHGEKNYPLRKEKSDLDIGMPDGTTDKIYLNTLSEILPRIIKQQKPDFIFYLSGVDILESDKLGRLAISKNGCKERDRIVFELCKKQQIPVAVSMGGGYSEQIRDIIDAHANTFRMASDIYA